MTGVLQRYNQHLNPQLSSALRNSGETWYGWSGVQMTVQPVNYNSSEAVLQL